MGQRIRVRRDTSANWSTSNQILLDGEQGYDKTLKQFKTGDGVTAWATLPFNRIDAAQVDNLPAAGQSAAQVTAAITSYNYQTAPMIVAYVTGLGYQTAAQVSAYVTGLGYQTAAQVAALGYQTAAQVTAAITGYAYQTAAQVTAAIAAAVIDGGNAAG
jgi:hypothetical protein